MWVRVVLVVEVCEKDVVLVCEVVEIVELETGGLDSGPSPIDCDLFGHQK